LYWTVLFRPSHSHWAGIGRPSAQWAYRQSVRLQVIDPGEPVQDAVIDSFNGRLQDEGLNEHWFLSLANAWLIRRSVAAGRQSDAPT